MSGQRGGGPRGDGAAAARGPAAGAARGPASGAARATASHPQEERQEGRQEGRKEGRKGQEEVWQGGPGRPLNLLRIGVDPEGLHPQGGLYKRLREKISPSSSS